MKDQADYSQYECPYSHIEKECGHELHGPEGYEADGIWCACGYRGPVFCLDPDKLGLKKKPETNTTPQCQEDIYDSKISPLMQQIVETCKEHKIAMVACFGCANEEFPDQTCKTLLTTPEFNPPEFMVQAGGVINNMGRPAPMNLTTVHKDGSKTLTTVLG